MSIRTISTDQLRRMGDQEGLILQGCGGDPQEWVDGINQILTEEGILKKGAGFEDAYTFQHDGLTCLLFPFKQDMEMDMGKLAVWRLATHSTFGGTWLSDYVPNRLGGFVQVQESKAEPEQVKQNRRKPFFRSIHWYIPRKPCQQNQTLKRHLCLKKLNSKHNKTGGAV